jgi:hypothetical protein
MAPSALAAFVARHEWLDVDASADRLESPERDVSQSRRRAGVQDLED